MQEVGWFTQSPGSATLIRQTKGAAIPPVAVQRQIQSRFFLFFFFPLLLIHSSSGVSFSSVILPFPVPLIVKLLTREAATIFAF